MDGAQHLILGIDIGTSSVKAAVLDAETAQPLSPIARVSYPLDSPVQYAVEVPARRIWNALVSAVRQSCHGEHRLQIAGIGLSCLTPALVLLDEKDEPLLPVWMHLDRRSRPAARQVWDEVGPSFQSTTGNRPLPGGMSAICYRQIVTETPAVGTRVRAYLHLNGWLGLQLTGRKAFDPANASFSGLYATLGNQQWSRHWCEYFGVQSEWLPEVISGDALLGTLRPEAAAELRLPAGLPVKLGTADTSSAMLEAGIKPGELLHVVGTTQVLAAIPPHPSPGEHRLVRQLGVGSAFVHVTHNPVGGAALEWLRELCFHDLKSPQEFYDDILPFAMERPTSVILDPPFLGGDRLEIEPQSAGLKSLSLATDRLDLLAATAQAMRRGHAEALAHLGAPGRFSRVCLTGGGATAVRRLLYGADTRVELVVEGSLRGVARLFSPK